jgi:hypothetical protein
MMVPAGVVCPRGNCTTTPVSWPGWFFCALGYTGRMADPTYLDDPSFAEEHDGPEVTSGYGNPTGNHDPSEDQIRRRCEAIRRCYPRRPVGESAEPWTPPEVEGPADFDVGKVA